MESEAKLIHKLNEVIDKWRHTQTIEDADAVADTLYDLFKVIEQRDYRLANNLAWCVRFGMEMPNKRLFDRLGEVIFKEK